MKLTFSSKKDGRNNSYKVFLNSKEIGIADDWSSVERPYCITFNKEILEFSLEYSIKNLFENNIDFFILQIDEGNNKNLSWLDFDKSNLWIEHNFTYNLSCMPNFLKWKEPVDFITLVDQLEESLKDKGVILERGKDLIEEGFYIMGEIDSHQNLNNEYNRILKIVDQETKLIFSQQNYTKDTHELLSVFSFPFEVRQACEQYLLYFSKFLEDLGIDVTSKMDSKEMETFFSVTPKNPKEALTNIRELLDIYLALPKVDNFESEISNNNNISVQQLLSNIYHLKSQLYLSASIIQMKDATIQSLELSNYQIKQVIESKATNTENEKTLDGLLIIKKFDGKGFSIDFPEIFRRLKRRFTK